MLHETVTRRNLRYLPAADKAYTFVKLEEAGAAALDAVYALYTQQRMMDQRDKAKFVALLRTWQAQGYAVLQEGKPFGYLCSQGEQLTECVLSDDALLPEVFKAWLAFCGRERCIITLPLHRVQAVDAIRFLAEDWQLRDSLMLHVLDWPAVIGGLLRLRQA